MSEKKIIFTKNLDFGALSNARTEHVRVLEAEFSVAKGQLNSAVFKIGVNVFGMAESSPSYYKKISHREMRYSSVTGQISCTLPQAASFPLKGRTALEFEALSAFSDKMRELLGLDKNFVEEYDAPPPDELAELKKELTKAQESVYPLQSRIKELEEQIKDAAESLTNAAHKLK